MRKTFGAAMVAATLVLTMAGCGSARPSAGDISSSIQKEAKKGDASFGKVTKKQADCIGKVLHDSKISDEGLKAIKRGDTKYKESKADDKAVTAVAAKLGACIKPS